MSTKRNNSTTVNPMPAMPALPKMRTAKPTRPCVCGCGMPTKGTWFPGHDGRAKGWALRVQRGVMAMDEVPANERAGAELMLARLEAANAEAVNQ